MKENVKITPKYFSINDSTCHLSVKTGYNFRFTLTSIKKWRKFTALDHTVSWTYTVG